VLHTTPTNLDLVPTPFARCPQVSDIHDALGLPHPAQHHLSSPDHALLLKQPRHVLRLAGPPRPRDRTYRVCALRPLRDVVAPALRKDLRKAAGAMLEQQAHNRRVAAGARVIQRSKAAGVASRDVRAAAEEDPHTVLASLRGPVA
jgi:hypothetical protein